MPMPDNPNKRRFRRWQMKHPAKLLLEGAVAEANCSILDISLKGVQIALSLKLEKDKFVRLRLILQQEFTLNIEAWVVWHRAIDGMNIYGLYFTQISDSDKEKIYQFMCRCYPGQIKEQICQGLEKGGEEMTEPRFEDRRIFDRFSARIPVRFLDTSANLEGKAETCDVSAKGLGLVASEGLRYRTPLELWLEIPDRGEPLYTRGQVAWSKMVQPNKYRVGINLEKADLMGLSRVLRIV